VVRSCIAIAWRNCILKLQGNKHNKGNIVLTSLTRSPHFFRPCYQLIGFSLHLRLTTIDLIRTHYSQAKIATKAVREYDLQGYWNFYLTDVFTAFINHSMDSIVFTVTLYNNPMPLGIKHPLAHLQIHLAPYQAN
jgi:hypothetical protein